MKVSLQTTMQLVGILALVSAQLSTAESLTKDGNKRELKNPHCSLSVGEKRNQNAKHTKRDITLNLPPQACGNSDVLHVEIPHHRLSRSFKKLKSKSHNGKAKKSMNYWYGEDEVDGSSFNYVQDEDGNMHGSLIDLTTDSVMQFTVEDGSPVVVITKSSDFGDEIDPPNDDDLDDLDDGERKLFSDSTEAHTEMHESARSHLRISNSLSNKENQEQSRALLDDNGGNLDIMVVWTSKSECKNYGLPDGCTLTDSTAAAMEARIALAIEETNTAFELSGVKTRLYLAHSYRHPTFTELSSMPDTLSALKNGQIPGTEENRIAYGADIVAMIADDSSFCGIGYIGPRTDLMYSVTAWDCATGYFSFGHEIGHNLGLRHDRGTTNGCEKLNRYHFGYRDPAARFRTILAYDCIQGQCDNNPGGGCTRIQRFSNNFFEYDGMPVGSEYEDNAWKINRMRSQVALYFPHGGTGGGTDGGSDGSDGGNDGSDNGTTEAPSESPFASPSAAPIQTATTCNDSPLEFFYGGQSMTCETIDSGVLCSDAEIQAICPGTCGTCSNCVDPALQITYYNTNKLKYQTKDCSVVAINAGTRCTFEGVSDTCRATCGTC